MLGHVWKPTADVFIFKIAVNLSTKKRGVRTEGNLSTEDIPRLPTFQLTKRILLGVVMSQ